MRARSTRLAGSVRDRAINLNFSTSESPSDNSIARRHAAISLNPSSQSPPPHKELETPDESQAKELGYPHELWTTRLLARHAREHGPAEGHPALANTKTAVARVAAPDWSWAGSRGRGANPRHRASGCRRHTAGLRHRACASAGH